MNPIAVENENQRMQNAFGHIGNFMQGQQDPNQQPSNQNYPQAPM